MKNEIYIDQDFTEVRKMAWEPTKHTSCYFLLNADKCEIMYMLCI